MSKPAIPPKVVAELNRQINQELAAEHSYHALSAWCADQNLKGFAAFFAEQGAEEQEHAGKIMSHLSDRRVLPELGSVPALKREFASLLEAAQHAQAMEKANTRGIHSVYETAHAAKDYPAQVLMHWFINEQVEEEAQTNMIYEQLKMIGEDHIGGIFMLDHRVSKRE